MGSKIREVLRNIATSGISGSLDSEVIRKVILINLFSSVGIFFMFLLGAIDIAERKTILGIILLCFGIIFLFFFFFLRATKKYIFPGYSVVLLMLLLLSYLLFTGASEKSGYLWYYVFPATALFILGRKKGLFLITGSVVITSLIFYLFPHVDSLKNYVCDYSFIVKFRFIASYIAVAILSYVFESTREKSYYLQTIANEKVSLLLEESLKQQEVIHAQKEELQKFNVELEKLSIVASETENAVTIAGVDGIIEWVNAGFTKLYGYTLDEFIKAKGANIIKASTSTEILETIVECLGSRQPVVYSSPNETKEGRQIWVQTTLTPVYGKSGEITKLVLIDSDITKIIEAEEEIVQQNEEIKQQNEEITAQRDQLEDVNKELEKLSIVARETDNSVIIADKNGNIEWVNDGFSKLWGYSFNEFIQVHGNNILEDKGDRYVNDLISGILENKKSIVYVTSSVNKSNNFIWIQTTLTPILDMSGNISRLVAIEAEITDIKAAEEKIKQQNEEILQQHEELSTQRDNLHEAFQELAVANELLTDSIQYARLIQNSILPKECEIKKYNPDTLILFKPKAIVSGDFYWFYGDSERYIIAVSDCTGHGVPGALMSMIGNTLLNRIIKEEEIYDPAKILDRLNLGIIDSLNQGSEDSETQDDGMDISICRVDLKSKQITISCANQLAFRAVNGTVEIIKSSIYSIGGLISYKGHAEFINQSFSIESGMMIYLFSDGYQDQFGGKKYDKFGMTNFEHLIASIYSLPIEEQLKILEKNHNDWKMKRPQTDDILIIGMRF